MTDQTIPAGTITTEMIAPSVGETLDLTVNGAVAIENATVEKKEKRKKPKFSLNFLFETSCWNPENFQEWTEWEDSQAENRQNRIHVPYPGWRRYDITTHCSTYTVVVKKAANGGWHIKDYIQQDH